MENLKAYKNQIKEVQNLVKQMEDGNLSIEDLTKLEALTRMIHERSIILKYLALGGNKASNQEEVEILSDAKNDEEPISFELPKEKKIEIDLFGDMEEKEVETPLPISDIMDDLIKEEPNFVNETIEEELAQKVVPEMEEQKEDEIIIESIIEEMVEIDITERVVEEMEEIELTEKVVDAMDEVNATENSEENKTFLEQLNLKDDSLHAMFSTSKIESLIGAFSLNEKLRFMNDLFDGSSEDFNEAVKMLDSQENIQHANTKINELAKQYEWDSDDEAVAEFVSFINRRYA